MVSGSLRIFAVATIACLPAASCGGSDDAASRQTSSDGGADVRSDAAIFGPGGDASPLGAPGACNSDAIVASLASCLDGGEGPRACLAAARNDAIPCDADADGMDDALEDAMMKSYAPVFAYNLGDGGHTDGSTEPNWPINIAHYAANATLIWRVDDNASSVETVDATPTLAALPGENFEGHAASSPFLGDGPNFWLCLNQPGGNYSDDALVTSMDASRTLADGIDVFSDVRPSGSDPSGNYAVIGYMLYYAYNSFSLDNHEGDWEGGAVFVNLDTGAVAAIDTERHATADTEKLVPLEGPGALDAKDPNGETPYYDVCSPTDSNDIGGVRFWDYSGKRHHAVFYPAAGSHASYAYPGATKIQGVGCSEATMVRDVHNGNAEKFVPFEGAYYADFGGGGAKSTVTNGVHFVNLGEPGHLRASFSAFAGQWGCQLGSIAKSYPGPWDNQRLCRHWLTNDWGSAPPFSPSTATTCD